MCGSLEKITPVVTEIKSAYDNYNQAIETDDSYPESVHETDNGIPVQLERAEIDAELLLEPSSKKARKEWNMLSAIVKVVNKPQQDGEKLDSDLYELVTQLLSKGMHRGT